jgi:hypothetical protein
MTVKQTVPISQLAAKTRELLQNRPRTLTYPKIYADTGITEAWLSDFVGDSNRDYGINKVELLYTYLTGTNLEL